MADGRNSGLTPLLYHAQRAVIESDVERIAQHSESAHGASLRQGQHRVRVEHFRHGAALSHEGYTMQQQQLIKHQHSNPVPRLHSDPASTSDRL